MKKHSGVLLFVITLVLVLWAQVDITVRGSQNVAPPRQSAGEASVSFDQPHYRVNESDGVAVISVTLDAAYPLTVTVGYATLDGSALAGIDYLTASGRLTFTPGLITQTFDVRLIDDERHEPTEAITLTLNAPVHGTFRAPREATLTIEDDDPTYMYLPFVLRGYRVNRAPYVPGQPLPLDGAAGQPLNLALAWRGGDPDGGAVTYDVYLASGAGTLATPEYLVCQDVSDTLCAVDTLAATTRYRWQVLARDAYSATTTGPVWAFTTTFGCPTTSTQQYSSGTVYQVELDNPVRPAFNHADKNLELRGYTTNPDPSLAHDLVDYGSGDPTQPPQLATLFNPARVPDMDDLYQVHEWIWADPPDPGQRGAPLTHFSVTALGMRTTPGESLSVPTSGYDIGGGYEVIVLFADEDTVALKYTRDDSAGSSGYTVHVDHICTDPNLLALYNALDDPDGPRYRYTPPPQRPYTYELPTLSAGQPFGTAWETEIIVAIVDRGGFMDPRSRDEWWQIRPD